MTNHAFKSAAPSLTASVSLRDQVLAALANGERAVRDLGLALCDDLDAAIESLLSHGTIRLVDGDGSPADIIALA